MPGMLFAIVLMGCSDLGDACETLAVGDAIYSSQAECMDRLDVALSSELAMKADFPSVVAVCQAVPTTLASAHVKQGSRPVVRINTGESR